MELKYTTSIKVKKYNDETTENSNGTYTSTSSSFGYKGKWSVIGNKFTAESNNGRIMSGTQTTNGNNLYIKGSTSDGYNFEYTFVRANGY